MKLPYIIFVSVLLLMIVIYLGYKYMGWFQKDPQAKQSKIDLIKAKGKTIFPLKKGSTGEAVGAVQKYLNTKSSEFDCPSIDRKKMFYGENNDIPVFPVEVDNKFGKQTLYAIRLCYGTESVSESQYDNLIKKL